MNNENKSKVINLFDSQTKNSKKFSVSIKIKRPSSEKKDEGEKRWKK